MTREEKISKLKHHRCYSKFMANVKDGERVNKNLDHIMSFSSFICFAFDWAESNEGFTYWQKISRL